MTVKKSAKKETRRTFNSPLDTTLPFQLVPLLKKAGDEALRAQAGEAGLTVDPPEPKVVSRLIDRIKGL